MHTHIQAWQIRIQAWYYQAYRALDRGLNEGVPRTANHLSGPAVQVRKPPRRRRAGPFPMPSLDSSAVLAHHYYYSIYYTSVYPQTRCSPFMGRHRMTLRCRATLYTWWGGLFERALTSCAVRHDRSRAQSFNPHTTPIVRSPGARMCVYALYRVMLAWVQTWQGAAVPRARRRAWPPVRPTPRWPRRWRGGTRVWMVEPTAEEENKAKAEPRWVSGQRGRGAGGAG